MQKLQLSPSTKFAEVIPGEYNELKYSVYFLDQQWNYLFVNEHVKKNLGARGENIIGKNMWSFFKELSADPSFQKMKDDIENGLAVNFIATSPINSQRLNIVGYPLSDCYFFYASQLPRKEDLLSELRKALPRRDN